MLAENPRLAPVKPVPSDLRLLAFALAIALPNATRAIGLDSGHVCDQAALTAAEDTGVPPQIMLAIARVESGRAKGDELEPWPWTINKGGEGHWFDNLEDAVAFAGPEVEAGTTNMDIGCFQLNLRWHARAFPSLEAMFDPEANARYAADFLNELHLRKGNWVDAVAAYHSETPEYAKTYVEKVEAVLTSLVQPALEAPPPELRGNRFPLLQPGLAGSNGSLVPISSGLAPLFAQEP